MSFALFEGAVVQIKRGAFELANAVLIIFPKEPKVPVSENKEERRKYPRIKFVDRVEIFPVIESKSRNIFEVQNTPITVKAVDLSENGIRLELGTSKPPARILKLNFQINKDKSINVYGKMAWVSGKFLGCTFVAMDKESRQLIRDFVEKLI
jgi:hypothetical protein